MAFAKINVRSRLSMNSSMLVRRNRNLLPLFVVTIGVLVLMSLLSPGKFFTISNFQSIAYVFPEFGLLAIAVMVSMLSGGIDLSIVGVANLSGVLAAVVLTKGITGVSPTNQPFLLVVIAFAVAILVGILCGWFNGFLITKMHISEILATLGTMELFTGLAQVFTKGQTIQGFPTITMTLGNGAFLGIPIPLIIFIASAVVVAILLNRSVWGFELYLMGTNSVAARFTGIRNTSILLKSYTLGGLLSSIAGILIISSNNSAEPNYGASYLLQTIVVAVLGGINPSGGFGTMAGLVLAIVCQQSLASGFNILRVGGSASSYVEQTVWGLVLLLVMVFNYMAEKRSMKKKYKT